MPPSPPLPATRRVSRRRNRTDLENENTVSQILRRRATLDRLMEEASADSIAYANAFVAREAESRRIHTEIQNQMRQDFRRHMDIPSVWHYSHNPEDIHANNIGSIIPHTIVAPTNMITTSAVYNHYRRIRRPFQNVRYSIPRVEHEYRDRRSQPQLTRINMLENPFRTFSVSDRENLPGVVHNMNYQYRNVRHRQTLGEVVHPNELSEISLSIRDPNFIRNNTIRNTAHIIPIGRSSNINFNL